MSYKIKVYCTSKEQFSFNNKKINISIANKINNSIKPCDDDNIDRIDILYKYNKFLNNFTH